MDVDQTWRNPLALGIDDRRARRLRKIVADRLNLAIGEDELSVVDPLTGPVENGRSDKHERR